MNANDYSRAIGLREGIGSPAGFGSIPLRLTSSAR
jgi:hypothetical protein